MNLPGSMAAGMDQLHRWLVDKMFQDGKLPQSRLTSARFVVGCAGANGLANKTHTRSCWKAGRLARSRFTVSRGTAGWLAVFLACDQLPCSAPAGTRQTDTISEVATLCADGDGGHSWNVCGVSRTTAIRHGAGANFSGKLQTQYT